MINKTLYSCATLLAILFAGMVTMPWVFIFILPLIGVSSMARYFVSTFLQIARLDERVDWRTIYLPNKI